MVQQNELAKKASEAAKKIENEKKLAEEAMAKKKLDGEAKIKLEEEAKKAAEEKKLEEDNEDLADGCEVCGSSDLESRKSGLIVCQNCGHINRDGLDND